MAINLSNIYLSMKAIDRVIALLRELCTPMRQMKEEAHGRCIIQTANTPFLLQIRFDSACSESLLFRKIIVIEYQIRRNYRLV